MPAAEAPATAAPAPTSGAAAPAAAGPAPAGSPAAAPAGGEAAAPLSFAERMKLAAERGTTQIRKKEEDRARREAVRGQGTPDFEERMRAAKRGAVGGAGGGEEGAAAQADSLSPATVPPGGGAPADGAAGMSATKDWGRGAAGPAEDEQRRLDRESKLLEASYAPEKIGRMSVILCGVSLLILVLSIGVLCMGGMASMAGATQSAMNGQARMGIGGGMIMSFGVCMFGFSPICAICGFILGLHSVLRSRHDKLWGALGTGLNGLLVLPPLVLCLLTLLGKH